ncbi:lipid II flippase MurJ [subsurface metagenome]
MAFAAGYLGGELYIYIYRKKTGIYFKPSMRHFDWELSRKLLRYGLPMSVWIISFQLLFLANRLIISSMRSNKEVGIYASSYDLINGSLSLMMTPFLLASHPIIMQLWAQAHERTEIEQLIKRVLRYLLLLCIPIFIFSLVVNEELLAFVLGQGFGIEGWIVPVLVAGVICSGFSMYAHKGLEIAERTKVMLGVAVITVCLNIVLNLIFIKRFGYPAAAIMALFSYLFYMFVVYRFSRRYLRLRFSLKSCFRIAIASGISGVCLWIVKQYTRDALTSSAFSIIVTILLFGCVYLLILNISGELSTEIKKLLKIIKRYRSSQVI